MNSEKIFKGTSKAPRAKIPCVFCIRYKKIKIEMRAKRVKIYRNQLLYAISEALDWVEQELVGAMPYHGKRVAYLTLKMAEPRCTDQDELLDLVSAALLHDNALTEYIQTELKNNIEIPELLKIPNLGSHCSMGEKNSSVMPFYDNIKGAILYHHEEAAGTGPFGLRAAETPLFARLIHLADQVDVTFNLGNAAASKVERVYGYLEDNRGTLFDDEVIELFHQAFQEEDFIQLQGEEVLSALMAELPEKQVEYTPGQLEKISQMFAKIIDYKSDFTCRHSMGIAEKAKRMGVFYGACEEECAKLYLAGALHDVGKVLTDNNILEKPGKLTEEEYDHVKNHAYATWQILHDIQGLEEVAAWAYLHHEKLDGSGYPFGKKADELDKNARLLACIDIYQALVEERPYKRGMTHERAVQILHSMAKQGQIDAVIVSDIDQCFLCSKNN